MNYALIRTQFLALESLCLKTSIKKSPTRFGKTMPVSNQRFFDRAGRAWFRTRFGIRVRLILLAFIAALPLVVDCIRDAEADRAELVRAANKQVLELARRGASDQADLIETTRAFLQVVGRSYATFGGSG